MVTHLKKNNKPKVVDISMKKITDRTAVAKGQVTFSKKIFNNLKLKKNKKGEIENIAILAGILGAKKTSDLIPLCHNLKLEDVNIDIITNNKLLSLEVFATVKSKGKTGVEMEALTAVSISCLTIYDMCKSLDKKIIIKNIQLVKKTGGKSDFLLKKS
tara:strand:- start:555 stop:1028 length:474 start_codon:yes stop_codon:yes gene_type:complete